MEQISDDKTLLSRLDAYNRIAYDIMNIVGEDVPPEMANLLDETVKSLCEKADSYGHVMANLEHFVEQCKARKKEWDTGRSVGERSIESLKNRMRFVLQSLPEKELQGKEFRFFLTKPTGKLEIDITKLPSNFLKKCVVETMVPDEDLIRGKIEAGEDVPGAKWSFTRQMRSGRPK